MIEEHLFIVQSSRATKLWAVVNSRGRRIRFPRIGQLGEQLKCFLIGHDWTDWQTDDEEGPKQVVASYWDGPDGEVGHIEIPLLSRKCRPGEFGHRACMGGCGLTQRRYPLEELDPDTIWPVGKLIVMDE